MATLSASARARLPDSAFAYVDSAGRRRLPINDASHVRNALARFDQVDFESDAARARARERLLRAARRYGIVPIGFFDRQLRTERVRRTGRAGAAMRRWPRGVVTLLLCDIERSTELLRRHADAYPAILRGVRRLIGAAVRAAGGHEVDARADEYFAAFADARAALDAALAAQRELAAMTWPDRARVRVRIGIHTGHATLSDAGYVGLAVHTAARICSAGHGGQIVVSAAARAALAATPAGVRLAALGVYSLPSIAEPMTLYQVRADGLRRTFPPLRS